MPRRQSAGYTPDLTMIKCSSGPRPLPPLALLAAHETRDGRWDRANREISQTGQHKPNPGRTTEPWHPPPATERLAAPPLERGAAPPPLVFRQPAGPFPPISRPAAPAWIRGGRVAGGWSAEGACSVPRMNLARPCRPDASLHH